MRESQLTTDDLIYPVFVHDQLQMREPITSMPEVFRLSLDETLRTAEQCLKLGIPAIALFPVVLQAKKTPDGQEAYNEKGLVPTVVSALKSRFPELGVITDIALDPYTSHGQDGLIDGNGCILNDETVAVLARQALCHAAAGADIVAPSDMMDGRIGNIRKSLDRGGYQNTMILSYAAKYASHFYGPFRDAVGSKAQLGSSRKETYQMDPANSDEALREVALDIDEGADFIMVKPALPYLDVIARLKKQFQVPLFAYQVSGEYSMLMAAANNGWIDLDACVLESLTSIRRAGAAAILTYFAPRVADILKNR
jgi:porphobilinogen synthase